MTPIVTYICEKTLYGSLMLIWLTIKVDKRLLPWAIVASGVAVVMIIFVTLNEMILTKVSLQSYLLVYWYNFFNSLTSCPSIFMIKPGMNLNLLNADTWFPLWFNFNDPSSLTPEFKMQHFRGLLIFLKRHTHLEWLWRRCWWSRPFLLWLINFNCNNFCFNVIYCIISLNGNKSAEIF